MSNPTTHVSAFGGSAPGWSLSGPERYTGGLWLEEETTNWLRNPSLETNTTDWAGNASTAISRSTDWAASGAYSLLSDTPNATFPEGCQSATASNINQAGGTSWALSATVQGAGTLNLFGILNYSDASSSTGASSNFTASGTPQRIARVIAATPAKTISQILLRIRTASQQDVNFYTDAAQVENKPYATSYCDSTLGGGYTLNGDNTSTRAASSASISPSGIFDTYLGAIVFRATPTVETGAEEIWGELGEKGAGYDHIRWGRDATKHPYVEWSGNDSAYTRVTLTPTVDAGDEHFYSIEWHVGDADFRLYLDDNPSDNDTIPSPQEDYGAGPLKLQATAGGVVYSGLMICNARLTDAQRARLQEVDHWSVRTLERLRVEVARPQFELRPY